MAPPGECGACPPASGPQVNAEPSLRRRAVLREIEAALSGARAAAEAIDCRTLAYFIETAIVELRSTAAADQDD